MGNWSEMRLRWRAGTVVTALALATPALCSCTTTSTTDQGAPTPARTPDYGWDQGSPTSAPPKKSPVPRKDGSRPKSSPRATAGGSGIPGTDAVAAQSLTVLPAGKRQGARNEIAGLSTKGRGPKTGYSREKFGYAWTDSVSGILWGWNSCSTRVICTGEREAA